MARMLWRTLRMRFGATMRSRSDRHWFLKTNNGEEREQKKGITMHVESKHSATDTTMKTRMSA